jgi:hypothetical protein
MPSLRELQSAFSAAVFGDDAHTAALLAHCGDSQPERGLAAYRRSVLANLAAAVRTTYPVVGAIVGEAFLEAAARHHARTRPSTSGDLNAYGSDFAEVLAVYPPADSLPYLPDVARLEWLVQSVYGREDAPPQDLSRLAATAPERWGDLHFRLDPAHAVLASRWPLARIWEVNQPGYDGDFQVDFELPQTVLIHRRTPDTAVEPLAAGEAVLLHALADGSTLGTAVEQAASEDGFDLQSALQRFIATGLIRHAY